LDRHTPSIKEKLAEWLELVATSTDSDLLNVKKDDQGGRSDGSSKEKHFEEFMRCFTHPQEAGLGSLPGDLSEVLADMAIASPAVVALRSFREQFRPEFYFETRYAFDLAGEFLSLFKKPESIGAVRLST